jgi:methylenetetrahydrofolate dehydrogenase (NADP+)/methenyltetrahydrofolate cyclohydrolase
VWDDPVSLKYIEQKRKRAEKLGIDFELCQFEEFIREEQLIQKMEEWNEDNKISWYIVQLPLPEHISKQKILRTIAPNKDVDGFHPINQWKLLLWDDDGFYACTPAGIMELLSSYNILLEWKNVVILWRSNIVWKPLCNLLINAGATVTCCNSKTKDVQYFSKNADVLISAVWKAELVWIKDIWKKTIIVDVGCNFKNGKMCGDCNFDQIQDAGNDISPVPGWVGPMTVAMLMKNTLKAYKINKKQSWNS